jgi:hypothetical protein
LNGNYKGGKNCGFCRPFLFEAQMREEVRICGRYLNKDESASMFMHPQIQYIYKGATI